MGRAKKNIGDLIGAIKDRASQGKAALISTPKTLNLHLALLRATTHDPTTPPDNKHLTTLLSFGHSSRAIASTTIDSIMDRLQKTHNSSVALKCLITIHHIIKSGSFILQDQLAVFPAAGGRNYLNLSNFRDRSGPAEWELSSWVRWYAKYVENILCTSRELGFFLGSVLPTVEREKLTETVSTLTNHDLINETNSLTGLLKEMGKIPSSSDLINGGNKLVDEIVGLVGEDLMAAVHEISVRVGEFRDRLAFLSLRELFEVMCCLDRVEDCREKLSSLSTKKKEMLSDEGFWMLIRDTKQAVTKGELSDGKLVRMTSRNESRMTESARFEDRVVVGSDDRVGVRFGSGRFDYALL